MAIEFWNGLKCFSEDKDLLEGNFEGRTKDNFHGCFWEIYLPKAFDNNGITLYRGKKGFPDFNFEKNGKKIWLEAVVCGEPDKDENKVPPPSNSFEGGLVPEPQVIQRLAPAVDYKIGRFNDRYSKMITEESEHYVIAVNGYRAVNSYPPRKPRVKCSFAL